MNQKTIKEHLKSFRELEREVKREIESAEYWKRKAYTLSAVNFDNMGITGSQRTDNGSLVIKFLEIQERCVFLAEEAQRQKEEKERREKEEVWRKKHLKDIELQAFQELVRNKSAQMDEEERRNFDWDAMSKQFKLEHGVSDLFPHELYLSIFPILYPDNFKYHRH